MKLFRSALLLVCCTVIAISSSAQKKKDYTLFVNPFIGTDGNGHTYPGAVLPYAMLQLGPVTDLKIDWGKLSRYRYKDSIVYGFSTTHLSGIRDQDYCDILFMPTTGTPVFSNISSSFKKKNELASPGYYKTSLDRYNIDAELTTTNRAGMQRYNYPSTPQANIIVGLQLRADILNSYIEVVNDHEIRGYIEDKQTLYFHTKFSKPFKSYGIAVNDKLQNGINKAKGGNVKLYIQFNNPGEVISKVGISAVSFDGALKNLDTEIPDFDFKTVLKAAKTAWINELGKIDIEGGAPDAQQQQLQATENYERINHRPPLKKIQIIDQAKIKQTMFYTALYHSMLSPNINSDVDGRYVGMYKLGLTARAIYTASKFTYYTFLSPTKQFRSVYPLLTLIDRKRTTDLINSFLTVYDNRDSLISGPAVRTYIETGHVLIPIIADAYVTGLRDFNAEKALAAMKYAQERDLSFLEDYKLTGVKDSVWTSPVSNTLAFAYNDWCIAQMAKALNKQVDYNLYIQRAQLWKNLHNINTGFIQPRANGGFPVFDAPTQSRNYVEGNGWQYAFAIPNDVNTLIARNGGKENFTTKLDNFFTSPSKTNATNLIGEYNHSNTPAHNAAYLFNFTDDANKTQFYIHKILSTQYTDKPDGLPGNDVQGQLSAWYVMSSLGLYNIAPGQLQYQIGLPQFAKAIINLENGKKFTIINSGTSVGTENIYLQGMNLGKKSYTKLYLNYSDIENGGEFEVFTGRLANRLAMQDMEKPTSKIADNLIIPNPIITLLKTFAPPAQVEIKSNDTEANTIHYTMDGSAPTASSPVYNKPVPVTKNMIIKAIAIKSNKASLVTEAVFK